MGAKRKGAIPSAAGFGRVVCLLLLIFGGCTASHVNTSATASRPRFSRAFSSETPLIHGQYADPKEARHPVYELFLVNTGAAKRVFTKVALDGRILTRPQVTEAASVSLDGFRFSLPKGPGDPDLVWWQFYPSAEAAPGASVALRLCFRSDVRVPRQLAVSDATGAAESWAIPRRSSVPTPTIEAISYEADLSRILVKCNSFGTPPDSLWVGGVPAENLRILTGPDATFFIAEAQPPFPLKQGMPIELRVRFADGKDRWALLRVLGGVSVYDAPPAESSGTRLAPTIAGAQLIPVDGVCNDLKTSPGNDAWLVIKERERLLKAGPETLAGFGFCTGVTPATAAIYGRIADGIFAKPYMHKWGRNPMFFLDEETDVIARQRSACAPMPFLYIPERFKRQGVAVSPAEVEILEWTAIMSGAKGLRRHFAYNRAQPEPELKEKLDATARTAKRFQRLLAPLMPVADETQGTEKSGYIRILTAWSGSQGVLYLVRDRNAGAFPDGVVERKDVRVKLEVPSWCNGRNAVDLLTGELLGDVRSGRCDLTLSVLSGFRLVWIDAGLERASLASSHQGRHP